MTDCCRVVRCITIACLLTACATVPGPTYYYDEIVILNQSRDLLRDVEIKAAGTERVFSCGNVAPRGICSNRFRPREYRGNPVSVAWQVGDGQRRSRVFQLELPPSFIPEIPFRGVLVIGANGGVSAYLQQDKPGPHL